MSAILVIKLPDAEPDEASRHATMFVKAVLAPLGDVEVFTFAEAQFMAHWKPNPLTAVPDPPRAVPEMEHTARGMKIRDRRS